MKRLADKAEQRALESEFQSNLLFVFTIVTVIFVSTLPRLWWISCIDAFPDAHLLHLQSLRNPQRRLPPPRRQHQLEHKPNKHGNEFVLPAL